MTAPALKQYSQGDGTVSADNLNTFAQTCNTFANLRAFIGAPGQEVLVRGAATINDGLGGAFYWNALATAADNGSSVIAPTGASIGRWIRLTTEDVNFNTSYVNPMDYGAVGDGTTDDTAAFQDAIDAAVAEGKALFVPSRTFFFAATSPALNPGNGPLTVLGVSQATSIMFWDEGTGIYHSDSAARNLFQNTDGTPGKGAIRFENLTFRGTLDTRSPLPVGGTGGVAQYLDSYESVSYFNCTWDWTSSLAQDHHYLGRFVVEGCTFTNIARDACRCRDTPNCLVTGNYFNRIGDDLIALHTISNTASPVLVDPIREGLIVQNNICINGGTIKCLGGRKVNISNNYLMLCNVWGIYVGNQSTTDEGGDTSFQIVVEGNIITDYVQMSGTTLFAGAAAIAINFDVPRGGTATNNVAPGLYNSSTGLIVRPWDWYGTNNDFPTNPIAPGKQLVVRNNVVGRTLPATAAFSNYGYGTILYLGVEYNPAVTDTVLRPTIGFQIGACAGVAMDISGNQLDHVIQGIRIPAPTTNSQIKACSIKHNTLFDIKDYGMLFDSAALFADAQIEGNYINCDYYRVNSNSNINGSYAGNGLPHGINLGSLVGVTVRGNTFVNCCSMVAVTSLPSQIIENNVGYVSTPVALGFSSSNKGIGTILTGVGQFRYLIVDSDPTSGTFGTVTGPMLLSSGTIPTSGWYYQGWIVWNNNPTSGGKVMGWMRLTTGTAHVSGTDWLVMTSV